MGGIEFGAGSGTRALLRTGAALLLICWVVLGLWGHAFAWNETWPMFRDDSRHTGYSTSEVPDTCNLRWARTTAGWVFSSPAVVEGRLYVGSYDCSIYCLSAETGEEIWSYPTAGGVHSSPAVAEGRVYIGSADGRLRCIDASAGGHLWNYPTGGPVRSSPVVSNGKVYFGSDDGGLYCLDAETGDDEWMFPTGGEVLSSPAISSGLIYVGSHDGNVYCVSANSGAEIWTFPTGGEVRTSPSIADGLVYVGSLDGNLYCLHARTGTEVWSYWTGSNVESSPAVAYGRVYVGSDNDNIYCLDAKTGDYLWSYATGGPVTSSPAVAGGTVCVGSIDGYLYCLNAQTGAEIWDYWVGDAVRSSPALAEGRLYVGSEGGEILAFEEDVWSMFHHDLTHAGYSTARAPDTDSILWDYATGGWLTASPIVNYGRLYIGSEHDLYCLDADTGDSVWMCTPGGIIESAPAVVDGRLYVGTQDKNIYCLDAHTGDPVWTYTTLRSIMWSSPAVEGGKLYVGSDDSTLYCLDIETGDSVWTYATGGAVRSSPAVADGNVYVGSYDGNVYCLDAETGAYIWHYDSILIESSPAVIDGKVYIGASDYKVHCLDAGTGEEIWDYRTHRGEVSCSPAVADGKVYVGSSDHLFYCLDAETGDSLWGAPTGDGIFSSPAVADGKVYVGSFDGTFYCFDSANGDLIWSYTAGDVIWSSPALAYGNVYMASRDGEIYSFGAPATYTLSVVAGVGGATDPPPGFYTCVEDSLAEVTAITYPGYIFDHWELDGLDIGSANPATVLMDMNYSLEAVFVPAYTLTITTTDGGTTNPLSPGTYPCFQGSFVDVAAVAEACYEFDHWELNGGYAGSANPYTVFMNDDHELHAVFLEIPDIWPMMQRDQYHTGYTGSEVPRMGQIAWAYTTGGSVVSSAAYVDGLIYVGSADGYVYCLDGATGTYIWDYDAGTYVTSSPAVANGKTYVLVSDELLCVDNSTGSLLWSYPIGAAGETSPTVAYGNVYAGTYYGDICCVDAEIGTLTWMHSTGDPMVYSSPSAGYGMVYIGSSSGTVYCLHAQTGSVSWSYATGDEVRGAPTLADSMLYVGSADGSVYCLNALSGAYVWDRPTAGYVWTSPAVADSLVFTGSSNGNIYCLRAATGEPVWTFMTGDRVFSSAGVAGGKVYVGSCDSTFYCLSAATGDLVWSYKTGDQIRSSPAIADTTVFVGSWDDKIYAFGPVHDIAVMNVVPADTIICHGETLSIHVTVENQGDYEETFGLAVPSFGGVAIPTATEWKTFWSMGDVDRNGYVDSTDSQLLQAAFNSEPGDPNWNPDADLNEDLVVDMTDLAILAYNMGKDIWTFFGWPPPEAGTQRGVRLFPNDQAILAFNWNSASVAPGDSILSAYATPVPGEIDSTDNSYVDSNVSVQPDSVLLTITAEGDGTTDPGIGAHTYACGCSLAVEAFAAPDYYFDHWELDGEHAGSANPLQVHMLGSHTLHAVFYFSYCEIEPVTIDFGSVGLALPKDTTFTVVNTGVDTLRLDVTEACDDYTLIAGGGAHDLAPGESLEVTVRFSPDSLGLHDCTIEMGSAVCRNVLCSGVGDDVSSVRNGEDLVPSVFDLMQNTPNPFGLTTAIKYGLPIKCRVRIEVYNVLGQRVATLVDARQSPGFKTVRWDTRDDAGRRVPEGVYFYRLDAGGFVKTRKMIFLK